MRLRNLFERWGVITRRLMRAKMIACCLKSKTKTWMLTRCAMSLDGNVARLLHWRNKEKSIQKSIKAFIIDSKAPKTLHGGDHSKGHELACKGAS